MRRIVLNLRACVCASAVLATVAGCDVVGPVEVDRIEVSGVPDEVFAGMSFQLTATPMDARGRAIADQQVAWASGEHDVAGVSAEGRVSALREGTATIIAAAGTATTITQFSVGPTPVGWIAVTGAPDEPVLAGSSVELTATLYGPDGTVLEGRAVSWVSSMPDIAPVSNWGQVYARQAGSAVITASSEGRDASVTIEVIDPIVELRIADGPRAMYVQQSHRFEAIGYNSSGHPVDAEVVWNSSDTSVASVDSSGVVTAVDAGTVSITAVADGVSTNIQLRIGVRPIEDWSAASPWTTFQGDARRTGFVDAVADPVVFDPLWTRTVGADVALNPVVEAEGLIFVTRHTWNHPHQRLTALDATSGDLIWEFDFGDIHSVHPPAYADGRVFVTTGGHQDSFLWAFDAATGSVRFRSPYGNQWSRYYAPTIVDGRVIMAGGYYGGMYAFDARDGEERWFLQTNSYDEWAPMVSDGRVYAYTGYYDPNLTVADLETGQILYRIDDPQFEWEGWSMNTTPVLGRNGNVMATQAGRLLSFDLQARAIGWQRSSSFTGNVTVGGDETLYVLNGGQVEVRRESDGSLLWIWIPPNGSPIGTLIATRNLLFVATDAGTYAVDLEMQEVVWFHGAAGHLAVSGDGALLISGLDGRLTAIDLR